jgi:methylthioribulose-1-phosphate dehydratase
LLNKSTKDQTLNSDTIQEARSTPNVNTCIKSTKSKKQNVNQKKSTLIVQQDEMSSKEHPRKLIPELCKLFYTNGWVTGTGGGISIKLNDKIFIAPSGVQKERIESEDIFVQDIDGQDIEVPPIEKHLSKSQCTPIFMCSFSERNAGAVIHVHSQEIVKLCLLNPENEIRIRDLEIIKGVFNEEKSKFYDNDEEVIIPIIENSKYEKDLVHTFMIALKKYPQTSAVLVRNHGMYVWGKDWKLAKTQCECYIYAFNIMIFKKLNNL